MRKLFLPLLVGLLLGIAVGPSSVSGQLALSPTSASPGQTISSAIWTSLFTTISNNALNRTGGTMTGNLLFSPDNALDLGASGTSRPRDLFLGRNAVIGGTLGVTGATTLAALSATSGTFSSTLGVTGVATLSGGATVTGTVAATAFSGSGASLTSIPETAITDGSLLARVAANETISGLWAFSNPVTNFAGDAVFTNGRGIYADNSIGVNIPLAFITASNQVIYGSPSIAETTTTFLNAGNEISFGVNGVTRATINSSGTLTHHGAVALTGVISPPTISVTFNHDYNPSGFSTAFLVRLTSGGGPSNITGMLAQPAGALKMLCLVGGSAATILAEDTGSLAANRFANALSLGSNECVLSIYDGTSSRWRAMLPAT